MSPFKRCTFSSRTSAKHDIANKYICMVIPLGGGKVQPPLHLAEPQSFNPGDFIPPQPEGKKMR